MSRETVVVCVVVPLLAEMVMAWVPVDARRETVIFMLEVLAPVREVGLKVMVTPEG
jgi:hypothetical protein